MTEQVRSLALQWLSGLPDSDLWQISGVEKYGEVWVAFYRRRDGELVAGNAPLIVELDTRRVLPTGTANSLDYYLTNYRRTGDPSIEAARKVRISGVEDHLSNVGAVRALAGFAGKTFTEALAIASDARREKEASVAPAEGIDVDRLLEVVRAEGFRADIIWEPKNRKAAQPGATDNPDDAQRLREDH